MLLWLLIYIFLFGFCRGVNSYIVPFFFGIYILVDTYMRFLERGRELIAAQVVETSC